MQARRALQSVESGASVAWIPAALGAIRDPFDRLIVGASRAVEAKLITEEGRLSEHGLMQTVWA